MEPIPVELIDAIPETVEAERGSCENAADAALNVLFLIGEQFKKYLTFPPIISNGVELWPMPPPYHMAFDEGQKVIHERLNEFLRHTKINAKSFNDEVATNNVPGAKSIAEITPKDSGQIWNDANALARHVEEDDIYRTLLLSEATKWAYRLANTTGQVPPVTEEEQNELRKKIDEKITEKYRNQTYEERNPPPPDV